MAVQSDGKILVGGNFTTYKGVTANRIIRLMLDGTTDAGFNIGTGFNGAVITIALQSDGKILVGGNFTSFNDVTSNRIIRLNADGSQDTSFVVGTGFNNNVKTIALQPDGKVLVGGSFTSYNDVTDIRIIRLNADGSQDTSFVVGTGFNNNVKTSALQPDGKVLVGGSFTSYNDVTDIRIIRLNTDGTRDAGFTIGTGFNNNVKTIALQPDGKVLVGGSFTSYTDVSDIRIIRLNTDGPRDAGFTIGTGFNSDTIYIASQPDGKIIVGGTFSTYNGVSANNIIRLNADGTRDTSFNIGAGFNSTVYTIALQTDGKMLVGGSFASYNDVSSNKFIRLNTSGTRDTSFSSIGTLTTGFNNATRATQTQSDGKLIIGGDFFEFKGVASNRIVRLNADGTRDASFNIGTGFNNNVNTIALQPDGKVLVGGSFTSYKGVTANRIIRLNTDGTRDAGFTIGTGFFNGQIFYILLQTDGKIIVGGTFTAYNEVSANYIIRLNADGTRDTSFNIGTGFNGWVKTIALQPDGKVLVGGSFTSYNGLTANRIIRLNTNGTRDAGFTIGTGFNSDTIYIASQPDGKIIVGGTFSTYNGVSANNIIRLNADGTRDTSFNIGAGFNSTVYTIALQTDGKMLVGGSFASYNDVSSNKFIRLNTSGTRDTSFSSIGTLTTGFNNATRATQTQSDGKLIIGGDFFEFKGVASNRIVRLNADGTRDASFNIGTGFNNNVNTIALQPDGKVLVGGSFTSYKGVTANRIIRLNTDGTRDAGFTIGTGFFNGQIFYILLQTDGKIIVGGTFTAYNEVSANYIIRLNADGTRDTSFNIGTGFFNGQIFYILLQTDGKIIVGGTFTAYNEVSANFIIRLNADGTRDTSFNIGTGFNGWVKTIALQPDGKVLVGGSLTSYNGLTANRLIRLNTNGTRDAGFSIGTGFNSVTIDIASQPDGKVLVGGSFTSYNGLTANRIIRLNTNGTRDAGFTIGTGFNSVTIDIASQPDGKVLVGGSLTSYNGLTANRLIRLNTNGTRDAGFTIGTGFNSDTIDIASQPDGKIIVGGWFVSYNGVTANYIIRLNADGTRDTSFIDIGLNGQVAVVTLQPDGKVLVGGAISAIRLNTNGSNDASFVTGTGFNGIVYTIALQPDGTALVGGTFTTYKGIVDSAYLIRLHSTTNQSSVSGTFIYDADSNGCTVADGTLTGTVMVTNGSSTAVAPTNHLGGYFNYIYATGTYTLTPILANPAYFTIPAPGTATFASTTSGNQTVDFCFTANGTHNDLQVTVIAVTPARPGFDATYKVIYKNQGTHTQTTGTVSLAFIVMLFLIMFRQHPLILV
ncbi:delta-60 repeat domain-containing protein [Flavobacterium sp. TH16-21]|uniref:Delta-60 repeat domain-containing protein n=1 Tax=Flavobacterium lacisediminis TaxID=2989705 RepID=A0ABT3EJT2_9FLAO|nr:delta-60 repeat domain-containing protein [Flavobacterium lacisediminis]